MFPASIRQRIHKALDMSKQDHMKTCRAMRVAVMYNPASVPAWHVESLEQPQPDLSENFGWVMIEENICDRKAKHMIGAIQAVCGSHVPTAAEARTAWASMLEASKHCGL
jgi:hypothetical protein